jgi:hypothetical protein
MDERDGKIVALNTHGVTQFLARALHGFIVLC